MRITIVSCVFPPEPVTSARTSADLARRLSDLGHDVHVITACPSRPGGRIYAGYRPGRVGRQPPDARFSIARCPSIPSTRSSMPSRLLENVSFGITSALALLFSKPPDIVYANTWPVLAQGILWLVCQLRGIPLVLSIQDIYPESLLAQNRLRADRLGLFPLLRRIDSFVMHHSQAIVVISEQFRQFYIHDRGLPAEKIRTIPNWVEELQPGSHARPGAVRRDHHIPENAFLVVYGGSIGAAAGLDGAIRAFEELSRQAQIYLLIAGEGSRLDACLRLAEQIGNPHIVFHHPWKTDETSPMLAAADLLMLPSLAQQSLVSVPSKLITYMWAARPILAIAQPDSETANIIRDSGSGWVVAPGSREALAGRLVEIAGLSRQELDQRGQAGREFARRCFSSSVNLPKVVGVLEGAGRRNAHDSVNAAG